MMKNKVLRLWILTMMMPAAIALGAQETAKDKGGADIAENSRTRIVSGYVNLNDSANVYRAFYDNTPIEPEFKLVPKFALHPFQQPHLCNADDELLITFSRRLA